MPMPVVTENSLPPSSRDRRKTLEHRMAGGERRECRRPLRISDSESRHHFVTGHVEHFATERDRDPGENCKEFLEQAYHSCGGQSFGKGCVSPHIGK
jgi:hypothetical protein